MTPLTGEATVLPAPAPLPTPGQLVALPTWAAQHGLTASEVRRMRVQGRLAPVYHLQTRGQHYYFLTLDTAVLPPSQRVESQPLEDYLTLHDLEAQAGPLRRRVTELAGAGRITPVGHHPVLLTRADAAVLLEMHRVGQVEPSAQSAAPSFPSSVSLAPVSGGTLGAPTLPSAELEPGAGSVQDRPSPPPAPLEVPDRDPALGPPGGSNAREATRVELPFVPQLAWVTIPRFEGRLEPAGVLILDRGAGAEYLHAPRPQAQFFDPDLARQVFPVLDLRPLEAACHPPDPLEVVPFREETQEEPQDDEGSDPEVTHLRTQLEAAQAQLEAAERALERQRAPSDAGAAHARMPDRRIRQLETALLERDTLKAALETLEAEQLRLLADQAQLRGHATRASHLGHVRERLLERFGLSFSEAQVEALDRQARALPAVGYTLQDRPFVKLHLGDQLIYALMGRDEQGEACMATVYDEDMFQKAQQRRSRKR